MPPVTVGIPGLAGTGPLPSPLPDAYALVQDGYNPGSTVLASAAVAAAFGGTAGWTGDRMGKRQDKKGKQERLYNTNEAAEYLGINEHTFAAHAQNYRLRPEQSYSSFRLWSRSYLDRFGVIRQKGRGRPPKTVDATVAAHFIAQGNPRLEVQLLALIQAGIASRKLSLEGAEGIDAIRKTRDYLLHEAGDWIPEAPPPAADEDDAPGEPDDPETDEE